jgi:hypothetical protein
MKTMFRLNRLPFEILFLVLLLAGAGCESASSGYYYGGPYTPRPAYVTAASDSSVIRIDPHSGTQYRDGLEAVGQTLRPFASPTAPINSQPNKSLDALRAYGTLLDLLNGK